MSWAQVTPWAAGGHVGTTVLLIAFAYVMSSPGPGRVGDGWRSE